MAGKEGRLARRIPLRFRVLLVGLEATRKWETVCTENVSPEGMRVLTDRPWRRQEELLMSVGPVGPRRHGRIIYCKPRADGKYEVGIKWKDSPINWADVYPEEAKS